MATEVDMSREGHGERCYYCGDPCNSVAGDPGRWPVALGQPSGVQWHHAGCVIARLHTRDAARAEVEKLRAELACRDEEAYWRSEYARTPESMRRVERMTKKDLDQELRDAGRGHLVRTGG